MRNSEEWETGRWFLGARLFLPAGGCREWRTGWELGAGPVGTQAEITDSGSWGLGAGNEVLLWVLVLGG